MQIKPYFQCRAVSAPDARASFTLVEMMVVLVIIVTLAGLILPVVFKSWERAARRQAQAEANSLMLALKSYQNIFGKWPAQTAANDIVYFTNNYMVVTPLMGMNPRKQSFISIEKNALDANSNYLDPEGIPYVIFIAQSGGRGMNIHITNIPYYNQRDDDTKIYTNNFTSTVPMGVAAFMGGTNAFAVNTWSDL